MNYDDSVEAHASTFFIFYFLYVSIVYCPARDIRING